MTNEEYREFLSDEIDALKQSIEDGGGNAISRALLICEKNRLVDKLYDFERKTAPIAFKVGDKVIGGSGS